MTTYKNTTVYPICFSFQKIKVVSQRMSFNKRLKYGRFILILVSLFFSCSKSDEESVLINEDAGGLQKVTTISNNDHAIDLYTINGKFQTGYNTVYFKIKKPDGTLINNAVAVWQPVMHMNGMSHSCPASAIGKKQDDASAYTGHIVFQMASRSSEYWELSVNYTIDGTNYTAKDTIQVTAAPKRVVESFEGSDNKRYVLAIVEPANPRVGINDMKALLYRMESMMSFVPVDDYKIKIDPRMPGMGNHGSPNNVNLTQGADKMYHGKLSLTMTGYWKINLQVEDASQNILKGEAVTNSNKSSSIYFEVEF